MSWVTHAVVAVAVSLFAVLGMFSCTADSSDGKTASTNSSTPPNASAPDPGSSIVAAGTAPTATATPPAWQSRPRIGGMSFPPDTTDYSRPARSGGKTP